MENNVLKQRIFKFIIPLIAAVAIIFAVYFYVQLHKLQQNPQAIAQQATADLIAKVSKLIVLPMGEAPTVITVNDPTALKDQLFFAQAQKGDEVLIYAQANKAILYSVALNKILNVAPYNIETPKSVTPTATNTSTNTTVKKK